MMYCFVQSVFVGIINKIFKAKGAFSQLYHINYIFCFHIVFG